MSHSPVTNAARLRVKLLGAGVVAVLGAACGGGGGNAGSSEGGGTPPPGPSVGAITLVAGDPVAPGYVDGNGAAARFSRPGGLGLDAAGNLYVADYDNSVIRRIAPDGRVTTWAGTKDGAPSADGTGAGARFSMPYTLTIDAAGNMYVTDRFDIRKITPGGVVTTPYFVQLGNNIDGRSVSGFVPTGAAADAAGNLYITTPVGTRRVSPLGVVTMLEGTATVDNVSGTRPLPLPRPVAVDGSGRVWIVDISGVLARLNATETGLTAIAGARNQPGHADGSGTEARFAHISGLAPDKSGNLFVADAYNDVIRKVTPGGAVTTVAGKPNPNALENLKTTLPPNPSVLQTGPLPGSLALLRGLVSDGKGKLYAISGNAVVRITLP